VVAYYPEVIAGNCPEIKKTKFIYDYLGLHRPKDFVKKIHAVLCREFPGISRSEVKGAADAAGNIGKGAADAAKGAANAAGDIGKGAVDAAKGAAGAVGNAAKGAVEGVKNFFK